MVVNKYPYTDMSEMNFDWLIAEWAKTKTEWTETRAEFDELKSYVMNYFDNLDVQQEINNKLDAMYEGGQLSLLIAPYVASGLPDVVSAQIGDVVAAQIGDTVAAQIDDVVDEQLPTAVAGEAAAWLSEHVDPETGYVIDDSLTIAGAAADAKATGDEITDLKSALNELSELTGDLTYNVLPFESHEATVNNVSVTYFNGKLKLSGTANDTGGRTVKIVEKKLKAGTYVLNAGATTLVSVYVEDLNDNILALANGSVQQFTLLSDTDCYIGVSTYNESVYNETINIMISNDPTKISWTAPILYAKDTYARNEITAIKNDVNIYRSSAFSFDWEEGGISGNGNYNTTSNRIRTKHISPKPLSANCPVGYKFVCVQYDKNLNFIANYPSAYVTTIDVSGLNVNTKYVRYVMTKDNGDITTGEGAQLHVVGFYDNEINRLASKKLAIYGDSVSTFVNWIPSGNRNEYDGNTHNVSNVNQTWWKKLSDFFGFDIIMNNSWSGRCVSTIRDAESGNLNSGGCEQDNIDVLGTNGTPDIIIVELGTNDINRANLLSLGTWDGNPVGDVDDDAVADSSLTSFSECYARMLYRIRTTYPNALIYCCTIMQQKRSSITGWTQIAQDNNTLQEWNDKIKEIASITGCRIIDMERCNNTYFNASDVFGDGATHPNPTGFLNMYLYAKNQLN